MQCTRTCLKRIGGMGRVFTGESLPEEERQIPVNLKGTTALHLWSILKFLLFRSEPTNPNHLVRHERYRYTRLPIFYDSWLG